jgi:hypothetical protein
MRAKRHRWVVRCNGTGAEIRAESAPLLSVREGVRGRRQLMGKNALILGGGGVLGIVGDRRAGGAP